MSEHRRDVLRDIVAARPLPERLGALIVMPQRDARDRFQFVRAWSHCGASKQSSRHRRPQTSSQISSFSLRRLVAFAFVGMQGTIRLLERPAKGRHGTYDACQNATFGTHEAAVARLKQLYTKRLRDD
jgi:hypothetical protein